MMSNTLHNNSDPKSGPNLEHKLESKFLEQIANEEPWKIALQLNLLETDVGSRVAINNKLKEHKSELKNTLGEEKFRELNGVVAYVNSMLLDFESALPYALMENKKESLAGLQENALLYGRSEVVSVLDAYGRKNSISELIIGKEDMQKFLVYHALPQIRLSHSYGKHYGKHTYEIEAKPLKNILDTIDLDEKHAIDQALRLLEEKNNQNIPRKLIFSQILGDNRLVSGYQKELKEKYFTPRDGIDALVKERAIFLDQGQISRLQFGDENPIFPVASNIFLVNDKGKKKVWKEDLKLYTDFSRLDGYSSEKEILSELDHPNIIKLLGTFSEKNLKFLELEYAPGKSFDRYTDISEKEALGVAITLCNVMDYLHSKNIVYMDMKKKNVMYNRPEQTVVQSQKYDLEAIAKNIKLLDFGMSQKKEQLDESTLLTTVLSTPEYLSPELTGFRASMATDTFQLGLLLHEMIYKKHAFIDIYNTSLSLKEGDAYRESEIIMYGLAVKFGNYNPSKDPKDKYGDRYGQILSQMLDKDPSKRPDLTYVRNELMNIYNNNYLPKSDSHVNAEIIPRLNSGINSEISSGHNIGNNNYIKQEINMKITSHEAIA